MGLSREMRASIQQEIQEGQADEHGVVTKAIIHDERSNELICVTEAPDEEAVQRHHKAAGLDAIEVHRAQAIL